MKVLLDDSTNHNPIWTHLKVQKNYQFSEYMQHFKQQYNDYSQDTYGSCERGTSEYNIAKSLF